MSDFSPDPNLKQTVSPELAEVISDEANRSAQMPSAETDGFVRVAKRISSRATDLMAISIIALAGLTMGEHLVDWWSTTPQQPTGRGEVVPDAAQFFWGAPGSPIDLGFGDRPYTIVRQELRGDRSAAQDQLEEICRGIVAHPHWLDQDLGEVTSAERRFLDASAKVEPVQQTAGEWQLYRIERPLLMIVGTRHARGSVEAGGAGIGQIVRRVICWSLALPSGTDAWTLFSYRPASRHRREAVGAARLSSPSDSIADRAQSTSVAAEAEPTVGWPAIDLPPGSRRMLALRDEHSAFIVFKGGGRLDESVAFYRKWFGQNGWQVEQPWKTFPLGRSARYHGNRGRADVQLRLDSHGGLDGVLYVQFYSRQRASADER